MTSRFSSIITGALIAVALLTRVFAEAPHASATDGQPVLAGNVNTETHATTLCRLLAVGTTCHLGDSALVAETDLVNGMGVEGTSDNGTGVKGSGEMAGVWGEGLDQQAHAD